MSRAIGAAELGRLLRRHREALGLSQEELARLIEPALSVTTIGNVERGRTRPYRHTIEALSAALGLDDTQRAELLAARRATTEDTNGKQALPRQAALHAGTRRPTPPATPPFASPRPPDARTDPFVGRTAELERAFAGYLAAAGGQGGGLLLINGESGVGKTRLAEELGLRVAAHGGHFLRGQYARESGAAFGAWAEALHPVLSGLPAAELARLAGPYWALLSLISPDVDPAAAQPLEQQVAAGLLSPADQRHRLYDAVVQLLRTLASARPLMLLLDDLHWAPDLDLLAHVARALPSIRAFVVTTYRTYDVAAREELTTSLDHLVRQGIALPMRLSPLSQQETASLTRLWVGDPLAERIGPALWRGTGGNPFLVRETLRALAGVSHGEEALTPQLDAGNLRLPASARAIVLECVRRLGPTALRLLTQAAVLGREFEFRDLLALAEVDDESLIELCERALAAEILVDRTAGAQERYGFRDDHIADLLYESGPAPRLRRWHLRAGQVLQERGAAETPERVAELARHFSKGGDADRGGAYSFLAGQHAERALAWSAAIAHYRTALTLWGDTGRHRAECAETSRRLGALIYYAATDVAEGISHLHRALGLYEDLGDVSGQIQVHTWLALEHAAGTNLLIHDQRKAEFHLDVARRLAAETGGAAELCNLLLTRAKARAFVLDSAGAMAALRQARDVAEQSGNVAARCEAEELLGANLAGWEGRIAEGRAMLEGAAALAAAEGLAWHEDFAALLTMWVDLLWNPRQALADAEGHFKLPSLLGKSIAPTYVVGACAYTGELERGAAALAGLTAELETQGQPVFSTGPYHLGRFLARSGDWPRAEGLLAEAFAWAGKTGDVSQVAMIQTARGELLLYEGDYAPAHEALEEAARLFRDARAITLLLETLALHAQCLVALGRLPEAGQLVTEARSYLAAPEDWGRLAGGIALAEGLLLARKGEWAAAVERFDEARETYGALQLRWDEAWTCFQWGAEAVAWAPEAQRGAATKALSTARDLWAGMGAERFSQRAARFEAAS